MPRPKGLRLRTQGKGIKVKSITYLGIRTSEYGNDWRRKDDYKEKSGLYTPTRTREAMSKSLRMKLLLAILLKG